MKTIVGIDPEGTYKSALHLCSRLSFEDQNWILLNAVTPVAPYLPGIAPMDIPMGAVLESMHASSRKLLSRARASLGLDEGECLEIMTDGGAAASLMRLADENEADLIVSGSGHTRRGFPWMIGSVSRALSFSAKQSLLITKQATIQDGPIDAIFATDHSKYANEALETLIRWAPKGLRKVDVLTAYEVGDATMALLREETHVGADLETWLLEHTAKLNHEIAKRLAPICEATGVLVEKGPPNEVIPRAMNSTGATLLIMGAQGHGFLERLLVGSTSLHQILSEPYPVLVIRPKGGEE